MDRTATRAGRLARRGFGDPHAAAEVIDRWLSATGDEQAVSDLVGEVLASADPDLAMNGFARLAAEHVDVFRAILADPVWLHRVTRVVGASIALNQHLAVHPRAAEVLAGDLARRDRATLRAELLDAVGADPESATPRADPAGSDALRLAYRRALLRIAARDLTHPVPTAVVDEVGAELADLADATIETALALARGEVAGWEVCRLGVLAMGKCGARELNYVSDVDVVYVAEPALDEEGQPVVAADRAIAVATRLAGAVARVCSAHTGAGTIWQVDANLRPEGKAGPLVRTLSSMRAYYGRWAKNWEFQAMLKARPMAGDLALGQEFVDLVWHHVWHVADDPQFVAETRAMRKRVISLIPARESENEIKLGAGGLRDTEFSVQLLQLVHGRADERLRLRGTFEALQALVAHGYVGRPDGASLEEAYRFQRVLEHRIQLSRLRRTHLMPTDPLGLRRLARSAGLKDADTLTFRWRASTRKVLGLHRRLFYSPLLEAVARIPSDAVRLTSEAAETRLAALGFNDPKAALRHLEALSQGVTRQAEIQRQLLPAMLGWFADGPNPDHGLLAFRQVSEALGSTSWYLRALRDEGAMAENLARILSSSRYAVDLLLRSPQTVEFLAELRISPRPLKDIRREMESSARRHARDEQAIEAIRAVRRRELLRVAMGDLLGHLDVETLGSALTDVTSATLDAALAVAVRGVENPPRLAAIALGRWGGREMSYSSDADALFVLADSDDPEATRKALAIIGRVRSLLARPGPDPALELDLDLRPEGKGGPIVRTMTSYRAYYARWASTWESQALLRASAGAGDPRLAAEFLEAVEHVRYPTDGLQPRQVTEIRKLKARMENERVRGASARRHVKLGPGGLSDVEWTVQLLQLEHGAAHPGLRTTMTIAALDAEVAAGLLDASDARALREAWCMATRIRNAAMLLRGRPGDTLPADARELGQVAELLGYERGQASQCTDDYARRARLARLVMDRVFWGLQPD